MRALIVIAVAALVAVGAFTLHELDAARTRPVVVAAAAPPAAPSEPTPSEALPSARPDTRPQVRRAVETIAPTLTTPRDFDRYVDSLEEHARHERRLSAIEVEPGFEAIRRMRGQIGAERTMQLQAEYIQRLNRLSAELEQH